MVTLEEYNQCIHCHKTMSSKLERAQAIAAAGWLMFVLTVALWVAFG